jgi:phosphoglycolate phosphatase-like HAD superfamily hydrolase
MALDYPRIHALCFDIDGTLSDTDDQVVRKLARRLSLVKFLFPHKDPLPFARRLVMATETPGNLFFGLSDRLGLDGPLARLGDFIYHLGLSGETEPFVLIDGVRGMLDLLRPRYPMSIVTARGQRTTQLFLNQFKLSGYFVCAAHSQTRRHTKPRPDPVLWAAAQMGVPAEQCLMIGDTTVDIRAGKSAGAQAVGVLCGFGEEKELLRAGADLILPSTADLADVLIR